MSESATHKVERAVRFLALLGGIALMGLMCLIVYSVFMRRVFNAPPLGSYDIAEVTLIPIVFLSLAYTGLTKGHIAVDLISSLVGPHIVRWSDTIINAICAISIGTLTWESVRLVIYTATNKEVTQMIEIPYLPFVIIMGLVGVIGFGIMNGWSPALSMLGDEAFVIANNYELMVIPLFILMGNLASTTTLRGFKLAEVTKYFTAGLPWGTSPMFLVMNKKTYEGLSPAHKAIIDKTTGAKASERGARIYEEENAQGWDFIRKSSKHEFVEMNKADLQKSLEIWKTTSKEMIAETAARGVPAQKIVDKMRAAN